MKETGESGFTESKKKTFEEIKHQFLNMPEVLAGFEIQSETVPEEFFPFHGGEVHVRDVATEAIKLALEEKNISDREMQMLAVVCSFHDTGFAIVYDRNEYEGARIMEEYLIKNGNWTVTEIARMKKILLSTQVNFVPVFEQLIQDTDDILCKIVADADVANFGREDFFEKAGYIFEESKINKGRIDDEAERNKFNLGLLNMLKTHHFQTESAFKLYEKGKQENIAKLEQMLKA